MPRLSTIIAGAVIAFCVYAGTNQAEAARVLRPVLDQLERGLAAVKRG